MKLSLARVAVVLSILALALSITALVLPGPIGPQGPSGIRGPLGDIGQSGPQGITGPAGAQGIQGPIGLQGPQGVVGPLGPQGAQGEQGPLGPQGIAGPAAHYSIAHLTVWWHWEYEREFINRGNAIWIFGSGFDQKPSLWFVEADKDYWEIEDIPDLDIWGSFKMDCWIPKDTARGPAVIVAKYGNTAVTTYPLEVK